MVNGKSIDGFSFTASLSHHNPERSHRATSQPENSYSRYQPHFQEQHHSQVPVMSWSPQGMTNQQFSIPVQGNLYYVSPHSTPQSSPRENSTPTQLINSNQPFLGFAQQMQPMPPLGNAVPLVMSGQHSVQMPMHINSAYSPNSVYPAYPAPNLPPFQHSNIQNATTTTPYYFNAMPTTPLVAPVPPPLVAQHTPMFYQQGVPPPNAFSGSRPSSLDSNMTSFDSTKPHIIPKVTVPQQTPAHQPATNMINQHFHPHPPPPPL
jgi:hypothetical protein